MWLTCWCGRRAGWGGWRRTVGGRSWGRCRSTRGTPSLSAVSCIPPQTVGETDPSLSCDAPSPTNRLYLYFLNSKVFLLKKIADDILTIQAQDFTLRNRCHKTNTLYLIVTVVFESVNMRLSKQLYFLLSRWKSPEYVHAYDLELDMLLALTYICIWPWPGTTMSMTYIA